MDDPLAERLARRRLEIRRRRVRRRRTVAGVSVLLVAGLAVFLLARGELRGSSVNPQTYGSEKSPDGSRTPDAEGSGGEAPSGARPDESWRPHRGPVPILMYHVIGDPAGEVAYPELYLSVSDFRSQVRWLAANGYTAVTLDQVQDAWYEDGTLPVKPIVLSFDDGYLGQYTEAMPILRRQGWAGLLNLKAEGSDLTRTEVKKMIAAGWEIAAHTITHPDLTTLDPAALKHEVAGSKRLLERELGVEVDNFCYPAGRYDDEVIAAVEAAGYRGATTVNPGLATRAHRFELDRIRIDRGDRAEALATHLDAS